MRPRGRWEPGIFLMRNQEIAETLRLFVSDGVLKIQGPMTIMLYADYWGLFWKAPIWSLESGDHLLAAKKQ